MTLFRLLPAVAVATVLMLPGVAAAHARLVSSTPVAGSSVASPRVLSLTFSEKMAPAFSTFEVVNAAGVKTPVRTTVTREMSRLSLGLPQCSQRGIAAAAMLRTKTLVRLRQP